MMTTWLLETNGYPLQAIRKFVSALWEQSKLQGMIVPTYTAGKHHVQARLLEDPAELASMNPFVPFLPANAAKVVAEIAEVYQDDRFAAVLRPCEARALFYIARLGFRNRNRWLLVGIDCAASFPIQEMEWRSEKAGGLDLVTNEAMRFARLGGIAPYRYRAACQMCVPSAPKYVDVNISFIGLLISRYILIEVNRQGVAARLKINDITAGPAPHGLIARHESAISRLASFHRSTRTRMMNSLPDELPSSPEALVGYLSDCAPCQSCLEACPIYSGELESHRNGKTQTFAETRRWLEACVMCGMCEQACPRNLALTAIHGRISMQLQDLPEAW